MGFFSNLGSKFQKFASSPLAKAASRYAQQAADVAVDFLPEPLGGWVKMGRLGVSTALKLAKNWDVYKNNSDKIVEDFGEDGADLLLLMVPGTIKSLAGGEGNLKKIILAWPEIRREPMLLVDMLRGDEGVAKRGFDSLFSLFPGGEQVAGILKNVAGLQRERRKREAPSQIPAPTKRKPQFVTRQGPPPSVVQQEQIPEEFV